MIIIKKEVGKDYIIKEIDNTLEAMQAEVGGYIETVTVCSDLVIVCDEEGLLKGLPHNTNLLGADFYGPIFFCGVKGDEFCDVPKGIATLLAVPEVVK